MKRNSISKAYICLLVLGFIKASTVLSMGESLTIQDLLDIPWLSGNPATSTPLSALRANNNANNNDDDEIATLYLIGLMPTTQQATADTAEKATKKRTSEQKKQNRAEKRRVSEEQQFITLYVEDINNTSLAQLRQDQSHVTHVTILRRHRDSQLTQEQIMSIGSYFPEVEALNLRNLNVTLREVQVIPYMFKKLRSISLANNPLGNEGLISLTQHSAWAASLRALDISNTGITENAMLSLARSFSNILILDVSNNAIEDSGIKFLANSGIAQRLRNLYANHTRLTSAGIRVIATSFTQLNELEIARNGLGDSGIEELMQARFLNTITSLNISENNLTAITAQSLVRCAFTRLQTLNIARNHLGDNGFDALAEAPFALNLQSLNVLATGITGSSVNTIYKFVPQLHNLFIGLNNKIKITDSLISSLKKANLKLVDEKLLYFKKV
jgi:hypothetical protein